MARLLNGLTALGRNACCPNTRQRVARRSTHRRHRSLIQLERLEQRQLLAGDVVNDLAPMSDEFDNSARLSEWSRINQVEGWNADQLHEWNINDTQPGRMVMVPETAVWYQNWRGPMVFKEVTGDFAFTTEVQISDRDDVGGSDGDDVPGDGQFSLGGVMIRTPRDMTDPTVDWTPGSMADDGTNNGENYVFLSLGYGNGANEFSLEVKSTRNSNSQLELLGLGQNADTALVQVARIGDSVITLYQLPGDEWRVRQRFSRSDMPETIQVGLVTYSDWEKANDYDPFYHNSNVLTPNGFDSTPETLFNPDLVAGFEYARFERPDVPAALAGVDLISEATDAQLLSFLGDNVNLPADEQADDLSAEIRLDVLDLLSNPISELAVGEQFVLQATLTDLRPDGTGIFSAYLDVAYSDHAVADAESLSFDASYPTAREANFSTPGLIDEVGAVAGATPLGNSPVVLFTITLEATQEGTALFVPDAADLLPAHELLLYGQSQSPPAAAILFVNASLEITSANAAPVANPDEYTVLNSAQTVLLEVVANDTTEAGETMQIVELSPTASGAVVSIGENSVLQYEPQPGFFGDDTLTYTIADGNGATAVGEVTVHVHKPWHNPAVPQDVNADGNVSPLDGLLIVNFLEANGPTALHPVPTQHASEQMLDVNDDGFASPVDFLQIANELNALAIQRSPAEGEFSPLPAIQPAGNEQTSEDAATEIDVEAIDAVMNQLDDRYDMPTERAPFSREIARPLDFMLDELEELLDDLTASAWDV